MFIWNKPEKQESWLLKVNPEKSPANWVWDPTRPDVVIANGVEKTRETLESEYPENQSPTSESPDGRWPVEVRGEWTVKPGELQKPAIVKTTRNQPTQDPSFAQLHFDLGEQEKAVTVMATRETLSAGWTLKLEEPQKAPSAPPAKPSGKAGTKKQRPK